MEQPTLVIVEDEKLLAWALTTFAEDLGYRVLATADTEPSAVQAVLERRPDVVLMDIKLARGSGLSAASAIRQNSKVPIVFCTAYASNTKVQAAVQKLGNTAMIGKPIDEAELADLLASALKGDSVEQTSNASLSSKTCVGHLAAASRRGSSS